MAQILFLIEIWRFYDFLNFFFKKLRYEKITELEIFKPIVGGAVRVHSRPLHLAFKYNGSNLACFRDIAFFYDFFNKKK